MSLSLFNDVFWPSSVLSFICCNNSVCGCLFHQIAEARLQEREAAGKLDDSEYDNAKRRVDVVAHCVLAEAEHFQQHRVTDFNDYMRQYLMGQIAFFKTVLNEYSYKQNFDRHITLFCLFFIFMFYMNGSAQWRSCSNNLCSQHNHNLNMADEFSPCQATYINANS